MRRRGSLPNTRAAVLVKQMMVISRYTVPEHLLFGAGVGAQEQKPWNRTPSTGSKVGWAGRQVGGRQVGMYRSVALSVIWYAVDYARQSANPTMWCEAEMWVKGGGTGMGLGLQKMGRDVTLGGCFEGFGGKETAIGRQNSQKRSSCTTP